MMRKFQPKFFFALTFTVSVCGLLFSLSFFYPASTEANATVGEVTQAPAGCSSCQDDKDANKPHLLAASYYSLVDGLGATLMLNNKGPRPLEIKPTLFSLDGQRLELPPLVVGGTSFREVDMREFGIAGTPFEQGSLQLFHLGKDLVLGAQVRLSDESRSLIFEEKLLEVSTEIGSRLEGVWWLPSPGAEVRLALSNTSDAPLSVTASFDGRSPAQEERLALDLSPHETRILDVGRELSARGGRALPGAGGVTVEHTGGAGTLLPRLLIQDVSAGYSVSSRLSDPSGAKSNKLHGAGLRLGEVGGEALAPVVVARNVGSRRVTVTGRVPYTRRDDSTATVSLPALRLAPGETKLINTAALKHGSAVRDALAAGLEFEYSGEPGGVIMSAQSVSESRNQVFQVPLWDIAAQRSSTGGYPWRIEDSWSTYVYLKNVTDRAQKYTLQISSEGAAEGYALGITTIKAGQTVVLDLRKLRDEQVPDSLGRKIPLEAARGQVQWSVRSFDKLPMIGRSEQVSASGAESFSYACMSCCGNSSGSGWLVPGAGALFVGEGIGFIAMEQEMSCYGQMMTPYRVYPSYWGSSNYYVANVDDFGMAAGVSVGAADVLAEWEGVRTSTENISCSYHPVPMGASAPVDVVTLRVRLINSPIPNGESDSTSGAVIATQSFQMLAEAVDQNGQVATAANNSVQVTASRTLDSSETGFPSSFNLSSGSYQQTLLLNRVNGTERGTTFRFRPGGGGQLDFFVYTYFEVVGSREGLVGGTTACGNTITPNDRFVALPSTGMCNTAVTLRRGANTATTTVKDVGPWFPHSSASTGNPCVGGNDPYWNTGGVPRVLTTNCDVNNAAIDIGDGTFADLGMTGTGTVLWRFN